jgi:hypothetical protein
MPFIQSEQVTIGSTDSTPFGKIPWFFMRQSIIHVKMYSLICTSQNLYQQRCKITAPYFINLLPIN